MEVNKQENGYECGMHVLGGFSIWCFEVNLWLADFQRMVISLAETVA